jgi:predicted ABC-type transport system involved in lysophospholipase L1 biosynthesis ATPase subunit
MDFSIRAIDVAKSYGPAANPVLALRGVSFDVRPGDRVALLGKSGSGKSTLLSLLGGLDRLTGGQIWVNGRDLAALSADQRANHRLTSVGIVFQSYHLIASRTALQNVELPLVFSGQSPKARQEAAREILEAVGLGQRLHHRPTELSGGERQRVALARALVNRPAVLLADEPTGNLDSATAHEIMDLIQNYLKTNGTTLMLVTHDEELARTHADRVLRLQDGKLI